MYADFLNGLRVCIYLRKSRTDLEEEARASLRGEKYDTLQRHRVELLKFAKDNNLVIVDIIEEVVSGSTIEDRQGIQNVLANVKQKKYDAVLCISYDRISRGDKEDQSRIEKVLKKYDTLLISPSKIYDLNSEEGELSADIDGFIARMEYRTIKRRLENGKRRSSAMGFNVSSRVPFGYKKDPVTKKLIPFEEEACIIRMIYNLSIEGYGCSAIATKLFNLNIKTKLGNDFTKKTVADIIKNEKYKGTQFYGITKNKIKTKDGVYVEDAHEPIISKDDWKLANAMIKQRQAPIPKTEELKNPFATILKCAFCEKTLKAVHTRGNIRLVCTTIGCKCRSVLLEVVEAKIIEGIYDILNSIDIEVTEEESNLINDLMIQKDKLNKQIQDLITQRNSLHDFLEKRIYTTEVFLERQEFINNQIEELNIKIDTINEEIQNEINKKNNIENLKPAIMNCMQIYFESNPTQKNKLLKSFISKILYTRHKTDNLTKDIQIDIFLK